MAWTVKQLARASGVSVRTLHFYDEIGLLKPAFVGANGYRFYEEEQLLVLQQILFYRELEFELKEIQRILSARRFDKVTALRKHRALLLQKQVRAAELVQTIDKTLDQLSGGKKMKATELFVGFDPKKQAEHEEQLIKRLGESAREGIEESRRRIRDWSKEDWQKSGAEWDAICQELVALMKRGNPASSDEVQRVIRRHFTWLKQFWTPNKQSYAGHGEFIVDSELAKAYEAYHRGLPEFLRNAIKVFTERELS